MRHCMICSLAGMSLALSNHGEELIVSWEAVRFIGDRE
jgi:hypothetical protein